MQSATQSPDGRRSDRMRTFMAAKVSFSNGQSMLDCTIRNISDGGAKLQISGGITLPGEFDLIIPQRQVNRRVRLCWRNDEFCGVAFLDGGDPMPGASDADAVEVGLRQHIRELETTIAQMQRRIDELSGG
jgi:hypothetical protein